MNLRDMIIAWRMPEMTPEVIALHEKIEVAKSKGTLTDELLNQCDDSECLLCGAITCPHGEPLHFHHDGCPACECPTVTA